MQRSFPNLPKVDKWGRRTLLALVGLVLATSLVQAFPSEPVSVGLRDFNFGSVVIDTPTAEKPQSKLWFAQGSWWGCMWDPDRLAYRIFRCDQKTQNWEAVGPVVESRPLTLQDCLYDGEFLYIASHMRSGTNGPAKLSRYSWQPELNNWRLDPGFPTELMDRKAEAVVIDKDSLGQIWATWEDAQRIWVNRTVGDDRTWGTAFEVPGQGADVTKDDICSLGAFDGRVGVMWSNQNDRKFYFIVHRDGQPDDVWEPREEALGGPGLENWADDHVSLKIGHCDGCAYAVVKTDLNASPADPLVYLLARDRAGTWSRSVVATDGDGFTRPTLVVDREHGKIHVFAQSDKDVVGGAIRMKSADVANPVFEPGLGEIVLHSETERSVNNVTSTKQPVDAESGICLLAAESSTTTYLHNWLAIAPAGHSDPIGVAFEEKTIVGEVRGTYLDTHAADGVAQVLRESRGGWRNRASALDHRWALEVPRGRVTTLHVLAKATRSRDRDTFVFSYSKDGEKWRRLMPVGCDQDGDYQRVHLPTEVSGRVMIRATDTNRWWGARYPDTLWVDHLYLTSSDGGEAQIASVDLNAKSRWGRHYYRPEVVVRDENLVPIANALVAASWNGSRTGAVKARTDWRGVARFPRVVDGGGAATFCVTDVQHPMFTYAPDREKACASSTGGLAQLSGLGGGVSPDDVRPEGPGTGPETVASYRVDQSFPNPFRRDTEIRFQIPRREHVSVRIFNAQGQEVRTLLDRQLSSGRHETRWDGRDNAGRQVAAGAYFYRVQAGEFSEVNKTMFLR